MLPTTSSSCYHVPLLYPLKPGAKINWSLHKLLLSDNFVRYEKSNFNLRFNFKFKLNHEIPVDFSSSDTFQLKKDGSHYTPG